MVCITSTKPKLVLRIKGKRAFCLCASSLRSLSVWEVAGQDILTLRPMGEKGRGGTFVL